MTENFFWKESISCNAGCHAKRDVGPATDYESPWGSPVHAPFAGQATGYWTDAGGHGIRIVGEDYIFYGQHLAERPKDQWADWREVVAKTGNSGYASTGPHIHAYIVIKKTLERVSFQYWYEDILGKKAVTPTPKPKPTSSKPAAPKSRKLKVGDKIRIPNYYWYRSSADAASLQNVHGPRYTREGFLSGEYTVRAIAKNGSIRVLSNSNGWCWLHKSAAKYKV